MALYQPALDCSFTKIWKEEYVFQYQDHTMRQFGLHWCWFFFKKATDILLKKNLEFHNIPALQFFNFKIFSFD